MAFHSVYNTKLYRTLKKRVIAKNKDAWPEISKNLKQVFDSGIPVVFSVPDLSGAFHWELSPQRHDYWSEIFDTYQGWYTVEF